MISFHFNKLLYTAGGKIPLDISCDIKPGTIAAIYGVSGAGKTTMLRILAGLLFPESGFISVGGRIWLDTVHHVKMPPQQRSIGFVFQDYALFPNMTVRGNLQYALEKGQPDNVIRELAELTELSELMDRYPDTLSGGQKQRVALARAMVRKPQLLLLDEPLASLDREMRAKLQDYILKVNRAFGLTVILVSHDVSEIYKMADHVFVIDRGTIVRQGTPAGIFLNQNTSNKFQVTGEILDIEKADIIYVISVLAAHTIIKIAVTASEASRLKTGDQVVVSSGAFNPGILPLSIN